MQCSRKDATANICLCAFSFEIMDTIHSEEPKAYMIHRSDKDAWKFESGISKEKIASISSLCFSF